jgi:HKD family nuclease
MRLISNKDSEKHLTEIVKSFDNAEEIIICTAFLKMSGLNNLIEKLNQKEFKTIFYVGTNFYQTEPNALKKLYQDGHTVFLNTNKIPTFHPKIFYFRNRKEIKLFIGSSNLTSGGLQTNIEASIECTSTTDSILYRDLIEQFEHFKLNSKIIDSVQTILDYENRFELYKQKHKIADNEFSKEEEIIIERERKREEERLKQLELEKLKNKPVSKPTTTKKNRIVITPEYRASWPAFFEEFKVFKSENNGSTIIPKKHKLSTWNKKQKQLYNAIDENGIRAIPPEHFELLDKENFHWGNPNEIQWMLKWENNLKLAVEYSNLKKQPYTWVTREKKNPNFKYKRQVQWCYDQRMRLNNEPSKRKITEYEIKRLKEAKFLDDSDLQKKID